ncbi:Golgin subfamily B member 1-like [Elysia marginata]|uniref:Golgin subfamily B member 1-like n=1 Tax=Elysia marginata TaxID=1093978 RepID=A0AAV4FHM8_9GAST|nr:Golgin subfamily B member 1-like [Elysia marginata]
MEERGGYYHEDSGYRAGGGRDEVYLGRPPPRGDGERGDPHSSYRSSQRQYDELPQGGEMEYVRRRTRSPASSLNGSFSDPDREPRVSSPKRVTWKDPVEQQKSQAMRGSAIDYTSRCRELERELRNLSVEKTRAETLAEDLKSRLSRQEELVSQFREQNSNLNHDVDQLISVVQTARISGRWEIEKVRFRELTVDQVFGSIHETLSKTRDSGDSSELRDQIRRRDDKIDALQQELKRLRSQGLPGDQVPVPELSETTGARLREDLRKLEERVEDLNYEIQSRDRKVSNLSGQLGDLQTELSMKDSEISTHVQNIKILQDKHRHALQESSKSEEVIRQLRSELLAIRDQHTQSSQDRRIRALESELVEAKDYRRKNLDEIGALQERLRESHHSTHDHQDLLKSELARRDDTIQKLRRDVLALQEKRDAALSEHDVLLHKLSTAEDQVTRTQEEMHRTEKRNKSLEAEVAHVRLQLSEADNEAKTSSKKVIVLEGELKTLRGQSDDFQGQVAKLTKSLQRLQTSSKDTRDTLSAEVSERQDAIVRLRNDNRDMEDKVREALSAAQHRGDQLTQVREELKQASAKTQELQIKLEDAEKEIQQSATRVSTQSQEVRVLLTHAISFLAPHHLCPIGFLSAKVLDKGVSSLLTSSAYTQRA